MNTNSIKKKEEYFIERKEKILDLIKEQSKCRNCWFLLINCICNKLKPVEFKHRYVTLFHHKEWSRVSNTGKLLTLSSNKYQLEKENIEYNNSIDLLDINSNSQSKLLVMNVDKDEKVLNNIFETTNHDHILVLFPSPNSITIEEFLNQFKKEKEIDKDIKEDISTTTTIEDEVISIKDSLNNLNLNDDQYDLPQLTMIILDGTWGQAKKLIKKVPTDIKRVKLTFGEKKIKSLYNSLRKQPTVDRISTLEASVLAMKYLGESDDNCNSLLQSFEILIQKLLLQNGSTCEKVWVGDK